MYTISGGGVFSNTNISQINANFSELSGASAGSATGLSVWVRPQSGNNNNPGTYDQPFASITGASSVLQSGMTVYVEGVLFENYTAPVGVNNVTIVGVQNIPRQATTSGAANGGGATWLPASGGTTALLTVQGQGWTVANMYFNNSATAAPCIDLITVGDPPAEADAAHFLLYNCILTGADNGLDATDGTNFVRIIDCTFLNFSGSGDIAINAAQSIGTLLDWRIEGCKFFNNAANIIAAFSHATITGCVFEAGSASTINLTGGTAPNYVVGNYFNIAADDYDPAGGVTGVTGDVWSNTLTNEIQTGLPAN
jgi:hypothetical protein